MAANSASYQRSYRDQHARYVVRDKIIKQARNAALARLTQAHMDEFRRLLAEECELRDVRPPTPR